MFQPGISGNLSGRPKGTCGGRAQVLAALDRMLSKECNQQAIFDALEKELQADPARFFCNTVVPLLPRSALDAPAPDANDDWQPLDRRPPLRSVCSVRSSTLTPDARKGVSVLPHDCPLPTANCPSLLTFSLLETSAKRNETLEH